MFVFSKKPPRKIQEDFSIIDHIVANHEPQ